MESINCHTPLNNCVMHGQFTMWWIDHISYLNDHILLLWSIDHIVNLHYHMANWPYCQSELPYFLWSIDQIWKLKSLTIWSIDHIWNNWPLALFMTTDTTQWFRVQFRPKLHFFFFFFCILTVYNDLWIPPKWFKDPVHQLCRHRAHQSAHKQFPFFLEVVGNPTTLTGHCLQAEGTFFWVGLQWKWKLF